MRVNNGTGGNERQRIDQAERKALEQLQNQHWLLFFENNTISVVQSLHGGVRLSISERLDIERNDKIVIRLPERNSQTKSYMWNAIVLAIGTKDYCSSEALNVSFGDSQAQNDPNFEPMEESLNPGVPVEEAAAFDTSMHRLEEALIDGLLDISDVNQTDVFLESNASVSENFDHSYTFINPADSSLTLSEIDTGIGEDIFFNSSWLFDAAAVSVEDWSLLQLFLL